MSSIHIVLEGGSNGSQFKLWQFFNENLFNNTLKLHAADGIENVEPYIMTKYGSFSKSDIVLVFIDNPLDNNSASNSISDVFLLESRYSNLIVINNICTEDNFLRFRYLLNWLFTTEVRNSVAFKNRAVILALKEYLSYTYKWKKSAYLRNFLLKQAGLHSKTHSINAQDTFLSSLSTENVAYMLLIALLNKQPNFKVTKGDLGKCWVSTCNATNCGIDAILRKSSLSFGQLKWTLQCGLYLNKKSAVEKASLLYRYMPIHRELLNARKLLLSRGYTVANKLF